MGTQAVIGYGFTVGAFLFMIVAFASPYWVESFEEFKGTFVKLGLWEFCFNDYTFYKDYNGKRYLGCFYVFSPEIRPIWEWVSPPWFVSVQVMVSASLLFIFLCTVVLTLYMFKLFPRQWEYAVLVASGWLMSFTVVAILIALIVFGVYKEDRLWIPRPDMNLLSWSYGLCCVSGWLCLFAGVCLILAGKDKKNSETRFSDKPSGYM